MTEEAKPGASESAVASKDPAPGTLAVKPDSRGKQALRTLRSRLSPVPEWLRTVLFRPAVGPRASCPRASWRVGWRRLMGGTAFVVVGAAVSLGRTSGPGALNTIWIEDAGNFLQDGLHKPVLTTIATQMNGYYDVVPRLITAVAVPFPLQWVPGIMSACAAVQYAAFGLIAYTASGPFLRSRWLRLLVAAPAYLVPLGYSQVNNDLATVQFIALYGTFWLLLWRPAARFARLGAPVIMLGITLSSVLPVVYAPLAVGRVIADRSRHSIALVTCWAAGLAVQWTVQWRGISNRPTGWYTSPDWILENYVTRVLPRAFFGELALGGPGTDAEGHPAPLSVPDVAMHYALIAGAWAVLAAVVVVALFKVTDPDWPLALAALAFSVLVFLVEIVDNLSVVQPRYVVAPALLLYVAVAAMLRPRRSLYVTNSGDSPDPPSRVPSRGTPSVLKWGPVAVFATLLAVVCGFNYRVVNNRSLSPPWTSVVTAAHMSCQRPGITEYEYRDAWWHVNIPCSRVRST